MSILFEPIELGGWQVKNRFVHAATYTGLATETGQVSDELVKRYDRLARGEVGLIVSGHLYVHPLGRVSRRQAGIHDDATLTGLSKLVRAVHQHDSKIVFQLSHGGRQTSKVVAGETPLAPSSKDRDPVYFVKPREMSEEQIETVIRAFAEAARRAVRVGADGVQIHAAHGYLVNQFLSPFFNHRDDAWGGSDEKRFRFMKEIVLAIQEALPPGAPLLVKLNTHDHTPRPGITLPLAQKYAGWLAELGIGGLEVSCGTMLYSFMNVCRGDVPVSEMAQAFPWWQRPLVKFTLSRMAGKYDLQGAYNLEAARTVRPVIGNVPLIVVGGVRRVSEMEDMVEQGHADLVSMSRPFIREPALVKRIREGKTDAASCVSCNRCCAAVMNDMPVRCYHKSWSKRSKQ